MHFAANWVVVLRGDSVAKEVKPLSDVPITSNLSPAAKDNSVVRIPKVKLIAFLKDKGLKFTDGSASDCYTSHSVGCFSADWSSIEKKQNLRFVLLVVAALATILAFLSLLIDLYRKRARERSARLFMLKVLTHDLRSPAASIRLSAEELRNRIDQLPSSLQSTSLQLFEDTQRLRRLIEASSRYLKSDVGKRKLGYRIERIPSLNDFVFGSLEDYLNQVEIEPLTEDVALSTDSYWLGVCLKNLVENAIQHGAPPTRITLQAGNRLVKISVMDQGYLKTGGHELGSAPAIGKGLGFGLEITRQILAGLRGKLLAEVNPTRFTIAIGGMD